MPEQIDPRKLMRSVQVGFDKMKHFRRNRMKILSQYVGRLYQSRRQDNLGSNKAYPINYIYKAVTTLVPNLVYNEPKASISTEYMDYRPYAETLGLQVNHLAYEINLRMTLRLALTDAIISAGWIKTGIGTSSQTIDLDGVLHDPGQPYADRVDPDDMVVDPWARTLEESYYTGNRFRVSKAMLRESEIIKNEDIDKLASRFDFPTFAEASLMSHSAESQNAMTANNGAVEYVDLVEVYLPYEEQIVTMPYDPTGTSYNKKYLRTVEYEGPERGPYHMLGFAFAPDNIMPVAPALMWLDLHDMGNKIARKVARQAERQKTILAYEASAWEDAADIRDADDGETVRVDDVKAIQEINFGGAEDDGYKYVDWAERHFSDIAMNIDLLAGEGTNEPTATQAEITQANTSVRLADMQNMVYTFTGDVMRDMMFFIHTDPLIQQPLVKRVQGVDTQVHYTPEMREGDVLDYRMKVVAYSMARQDPNVKVRRLIEFAANVIPAFAGAMQLIGPMFNIEAAMKIVGREMGIDELDEVINSAAVKQYTQRAQQLLDAGIPLDQKMLQSLMNPGMTQAAGIMETGPSAGPGMKPGQPNPSGNTKQGVTPNVEKNMIRQDTAGELQSTFNSANAYSGAA